MQRPYPSVLSLSTTCSSLAGYGKIRATRDWEKRTIPETLSSLPQQEGEICLGPLPFKNDLAARSCF